MATSHLPPIAEDPTLGRVLPSHLDHREFRRVPLNGDRYAARLTDGAVFDIYRNTFLAPSLDRRGARRVRIAHPNSEARYVPCAQIMALIVCGAMPHPKAQAHHRDQNPSAPNADRWDNVDWQSPKANRKRDQKHQAAKRRMGENNGRVELTDWDLQGFIRSHDSYVREGREIPWKIYGKGYFSNPVSEKHLRKIAKGKSRTERVAEIRRQIAEELKRGT